MMFFIAYPLIISDIISTEYALKLGLREKNPLMRNKYVRWIFSFFGKILLPIYLFYIQMSRPNTYIGIEIGFIILSIIYLLCLINNIYFIIKVKKYGI